MLTLTAASDLTKKLLVIGVFLIIFIIFIYVIITSVRKTVTSLKPPPPPQLTTVFGPLPQIPFPDQAFPKDIRFTIETLSGGIPSASPTAKIFFLRKPQKSLLTNIRVNQDAKNLSIDSAGVTINNKLVYRQGNKEFVVDPISRNFSFMYNFNNDPTVFSGSTSLTQQSAISAAGTFLKTLDALPKDYLRSPTVTFLTYNGAQFIPIGENEDSSVATAARVDYFRKNINLLPVVTPNFNTGNISVIVAKTTDKDKQIIKAERNFLETSSEEVGIYPIKSGDAAWQNFLNGYGYIANSGNSAILKRAVIRDSYIAYYDSGTTLSYLIPVYVFIGDDGFIGYVSAVDDTWISP